LRDNTPFLKLLEIGIYTQVYRFYDPHDADPWVEKFMADRKDRIEHDVPYLEMDFEGIFWGVQKPLSRRLEPHLEG
jgi:hypothetical protein